MTTLRNIAMTIGLSAVLGSAALFAQTVSTADIPFDFQNRGTDGACRPLPRLASHWPPDAGLSK
jgi:hypothetical protein